jgi:CRP-like cAMP-binding protein
VDVRKWGLARVLMWVGIAFFGLMGVASASADGTQIDSGDAVSLLERVPVFQGLDRGRLEKVAAMAQIGEGKAGDRIIVQGKRMGKMAVALDSEVRILIDGKIIRVLPPHSLVGEIEFLEDVPASADVALAAPSRVIFLEHQRFKRLMDDDPALGYRVMFEIARMEADRLRTDHRRGMK